MYFYRITLRLNGYLLNEVKKTVTAPEFLILQYIHGSDSIGNVTEVKNQKINLIEERRRLQSVYDKSLKRKRQSVDQIFGPLGSLIVRLPDETLSRFKIDPQQEIQESDGTKKVSSHVVYDNRNSPSNEEEISNLETIVPVEEVRVADLLE